MFLLRRVLIFCLPAFINVGGPWTLCAFGQAGSSRVSIATGITPDGVLKPWKVSKVACSETGLINELVVRAGDRVKVGDKLAALESSAAELQLAAALAQSEATGRLEASAAEVQLNERKLEAILEARKRDFSTQTELERAEADLLVARGRFAAQREELDVLQIQVERLRQVLAQRTITAPIDGMVVEVQKELGEYVAPNSPDVVTIVDVSRLRATFFLQLEEVRSLPKQKVKVRLDSGKIVGAEIEHISPVADGESGLIEVRVLVDNPSWKILSSRCSLVLPGTQSVASSN